MRQIILRTFVVAAVVTPSAASAGTPKVAICHRTGSGAVVPLQVAAAAVSAHLGHGDARPATFHPDADGDGAGDPDQGVTACEAPAGFVADASDCDDGDPAVRPGAADACGDGTDGDCSGDDALCASTLDGWTIQAGRVTAGATAAQVTATFTLARVSGAAAVRGGGACLVADLVDHGVGVATCARDADCPVPAELRTQGWFGYCASPDGSGAAKRCWTRPGGPLTHCLRSADVPERAFGEGMRSLPAPAGDALGDHAPVRWMVLACLAGEATPTACGGGDPSLYVRSLGPAGTWRPE